MAYRKGNRDQISCLPAAIDDYVLEDDPVRVYDTFIEAMDLKDLGLTIDKNLIGNPSYDPKSMLKLLVYGYSYGWRSSRKLERAVNHNLSFIWLMGGLKPDHKTIANFRKKNADTLKAVLRQTARICLKLDLIGGNCLFVDGTKIRGAASINQTKSKKKWEAILKETDKRIEELIDECGRIDQKEEEHGSLIEIDKELKDKQQLKQKVQSLLSTMKQEGLSKINGTDPECISFKSRQGSHVGMNAQLVTDDDNGLIVSSDVVAEATDLDQFSDQIEQAHQNIGKECETAVGDAGYAKVAAIETLADKEIDVIVPSRKQAEHHPKPDEPFSKDKFRYDVINDQYICPEGKILRYSFFCKSKQHFIYRIKGPSNCRKCVHFGVCTKNKKGRQISRMKNEELKEKLEARYSSSEGQTIYKRRKEKVEHQFGHIKRNLGCSSFLMKGVKAAQAEFSILAGCFNIARMITLLGGVRATQLRLNAL
jgi:transposase